MTRSDDVNLMDPSWAPDSCTLPTADRPLRIAEFDALFAASVHTVDRVDQTSLRLTLDAAAEDRARDLAERESHCCSLFTFEFSAGHAGTVAMRITVPGSQVAVLDALAGAAATAAGLGS